MQREALSPRRDWQGKVEALGLTWHSVGTAPYWNESAAYQFTMREVTELEQAASDLYEMFVQAGQYVVDQNLNQRFGIPDWIWPTVKAVWTEIPPALNYGRFDLGYDGVSPPKLFEYNCDTPTSLLEAAVVQWFWKEEVFPTADQFNSLHEQLIDKWKDIAPYLESPSVHFAHSGPAQAEDGLTTAYMMDLAAQAGLTPLRVRMSDIGLRAGPSVGLFDLEGREIRTLYKLYPWEWMVNEPFGQTLPKMIDRTRFIEPIWKLIWSNKAILPILWDLFPRHPNLLWASAEAPRSQSYAVKPLLSREGANITLVRDGQIVAAAEGPYAGPVIYQDLYDLPKFADTRPVLGVWTVDGRPAGMGVREDGLITGNLARFTPHIIT